MQTADNGGVETISALENHGKESCDNAEMAVIEAGRKQLDIACAAEETHYYCMAELERRQAQLKKYEEEIEE